MESRRRRAPGIGSAAVDGARTRFFAGGAVDGVREEIVASWRRSQLLGADPSPARWDLPYEPHFDGESPLLRAATPVLDDLAAQVAGADVALILSDRRGRIVARRAGEGSLLRQLDRVAAVEGFVYAEDAAGTNGLGTAVETGRPIEVVGREHYADLLVELTCVGVPLTHPITRQLVGVMDITCHARQAHALLRPLVLRAARDIAQRLTLQHSTAERALMHHFVRATHTGARPVLVINDRCVLANAAGTRILAGVQHHLLWEYAQRALRGGTADEVRVDGPDGHSDRLRVTALRDGGVLVGALLEGRPPPRAPVPAHPNPPAPTLVGLAGTSATWRACCAHAWQAARTAGHLTLTGEPGTGKFSVAAAVHHTLRAGRPLSVVEGATACLDDPRGWLTSVRRGTEMPVPGTVIVRDLHLLPAALAHALRPVLRELRQRDWLVVGTRTCTGEGDHPAEPVLAGGWVEVPPLRDHLSDIPALVTEFTARHAGLTGRRREVGAEVVQLFQRLTWPGNVAQLDALVGSLTARRSAGPVRVCDIPAELLRAAARRPLTPLETAEMHTILTALRATAGNKKHAAAFLGVSRSTLYRKLHTIGLDS